MTKSSDRNTKEINGLTTSLAVILNEVGFIKCEIREIKDKLEAHYVTQDQFEPIKRIVYGLVSVILLSVVGAILALVIKQ